MASAVTPGPLSGKPLAGRTLEVMKNSPQLIINVISDPQSWVEKIGETKIALDAKRAFFERGDSIFFEGRCDDAFAAYVSFLPDPLGAHWHRAFVVKEYRRFKFASTLFRQILRYLAPKFEEGSAITITADPNTEDGKNFLNSLGFTKKQGGLYEYQWNKASG